MRQPSKNRTALAQLKYTICDCLKANKIKCLLSAFIIAICLIVGIIIAIKHQNSPSLYLSQYGLVNFKGGVLSSTFFSRFFSLLLLMLLIFVSTLSPYLFPLAILILAYRSYLLGLNLTLLFMLYGVPGIMISLLIALPCQLATIFILLLYYFLLYCESGKCKKYCSTGRGRIKTISAFACVLLLLNLAETILLVIFQAEVILVL